MWGQDLGSNPGRMSLWRWADLVRELRYFWGSDCSGTSSFTAILLSAAGGWIGGFWTGFVLAALIFSPGCRKFLVLGFQGFISVLGPPATGVVQSRAVQLRSRLSEYREHRE